MLHKCLHRFIILIKLSRADVVILYVPLVPGLVVEISEVNLISLVLAGVGGRLT